MGGFVAFVTILLLIAEPLRNVGKYTMADVLAYRMRPKPVRAMAAVSTLATILFYMIAQMVGAGGLVALLLAGSGISFNAAVVGVGLLMMCYVIFGGMLATTWVQIIKAVLLSTCGFVMAFLVLRHFHFHLGNSSPLQLTSRFIRPASLLRGTFFNPGCATSRRTGRLILFP